MDARALVLLLLIAGLLVSAAPVREGERTLTLEQAVETALRNHPAEAREMAVEQAADARLELARTGYLPQLDVGLQANRGTANVVRGAVFPTPGLPTISGPVLDPVMNSGAYGTVASLTTSWDALGLLARMASVDAALRDREGSRAEGDVVRLQVAFNVADAFLGALVRVESVKAAQASKERAAVFERVVKALTENGLRPGADFSRAQAESALASTQLIRAEQAQAIAEIELGQTIGETGKVVPAAGRLLETPASEPLRTSKPNPEVVRSDASIAAGEARERVSKYGYLPRVEIVAALWARGTGYATPSTVLPSADGLAPNVSNWGVGLVMTWPALDAFAQRARTHLALAETDQAKASRREVELQVGGQLDSAQAILEGARRVADNTPIALAAARTAEEQATARYQSGLAGVTEVAEAQRLLAQAELDDAVARLGVRTGMLLVARAIGDIDPFLSDLKDSNPGTK